MMRLTALMITLFTTTGAWAADGLVTLKSHFDVVQTEQRLVAALEGAGMRVFARIDHAAGADKAGLTLEPTRVVLFGNPKVGTRLMQCSRSAAIDLPMKMLIWEADGETFIGYNSARYLARRHAISGCDDVLKKVAGALAKFAGRAADGQRTK